MKIADTNGNGNMTPTAFLKEVGAMLEGTLLSRREAKTEFGMKPVYTLKLDDYTCKFATNKVFVEPAKGSEVTFFAPTRLERQLAQVTFGKWVRIAYVGQKKVGKGNPAHIFDVEVEG